MTGNSSASHQNLSKVITFTAPLAFIVLLLAAGTYAAVAAPRSPFHNGANRKSPPLKRGIQGDLQSLAHGVSAQAKVLSSQIQATSNKSKPPTTSQITSLVSATQKYFSARNAYQKVLFEKLMSSDSATLYLGNEPLADSSFTALKTPQVSKVLLPIFQKYFSASITHLHSSQLKARRKMLYQLKALNKGQLSGPVWLYDSLLAGFASTRLEGFNKRYLAMALHYRKTHHYRDAENIYRDLLKEAGATSQTSQLKVLLTQCIIEDYNYRAKVYLAKHQFKSARRYLRKIIANYPDTKYASAAQKKLAATVPVAVNYFQKVADQHFHPKNHIGVAQNKAADYYKRMYEEDKSGPKAPYALYYWARALGTQGKVSEKIKLLQKNLRDFPQSNIRSKVLYSLGFAYCNHQVHDYKRGIPLLLKVAKKYPKSEHAPDALWAAAFVSGWRGDKKQAAGLLQQIKKAYPKSKHAKYVDKWIHQFQEGGFKF